MFSVDGSTKENFWREMSKKIALPQFILSKRRPPP
jgi:hypothetical protein